MRRKQIGFYLAGLVLVTVTAAITTFAQPKPDLMITRFQVFQDAGGLVTKLVVKVTNVCTADAGASYVLITFKESAVGKAIHEVGNTVPPLKAGESSVQSFSMNGFKVSAAKHILVEADLYKKVLEATEDNNWWTVNPYGHPPKLSGSFQCSPKM